MRSPTGDTYMPNNIGPRTEPWGTPDRHVTVSDRSVPTAMNWLRSVTNDLSQSRVAPLMPKTVLARSTSVECSTASNAADMSSASNTVHCKQQIWLRTALCGGWCRRMALRNRELHARNDDDLDLDLDLWPWTSTAYSAFPCRRRHLCTKCRQNPP